MPASNDREYRNIMVSELETRDGEDGSMIVDGYATTFNQRYVLYDFGDYMVDEEIAPEAFDEADMQDVIMQYNHEGHIYARIRNGTLDLNTDSHSLHIRARLDGTEIGRRLYQEVKGGYTDRMSFGFTVAREERKTEEDKEHNRIIVHRRITAIKKLYDISAVSIPANDMTEISARRYGDGVIAEIEAERLAVKQRVRRISIIKLQTEV